MQTTRTASVSTCRPVYCFRRTCGKRVLGTKVLGNAVPERTANCGWPVYSRCEICVFIFYLGHSFCSRAFSNRHDLPNRQSVSPVLTCFNSCTVLLTFTSFLFFFLTLLYVAIRRNPPHVILVRGCGSI